MVHGGGHDDRAAGPLEHPALPAGPPRVKLEIFGNAAEDLARRRADPDDLPRRALVYAERTHAGAERGELAAEGIRERQHAVHDFAPRRALRRLNSRNRA